jgi:hypothetical protein
MEEQTAKTNEPKDLLKGILGKKAKQPEKPRAFSLPRALLIPDTNDLTKTGILLYLMGIFCTFLYFSQFNILSVDFLKPQAIILGIYVWLYGIAIPRLLLAAISRIPFCNRSSVLCLLFFLVSLALLNFLFLAALSALSFSLLIIALCATLVSFFFHFDFKRSGLLLQPSIYRHYLFIPVYCFICSYFFLPKVPYFLGGFMPVKVTVVTTEAGLLQSRFSRSIYLLYETGSEFYFFEKKADAATKLVFNYVVKRVPKSQVKKLEIQKDLWQPF